MSLHAFTKQPGMISWKYTSSGLAQLMTRPARFAVMPGWKVTTCSNALVSINATHMTTLSVAEQFHRVMRVWKQWTDEHRTTRKTGSGRRKVTSARDDRHLLYMVVNYPKTFSRQLAARWSTATGVLMSASSIRRCLLHHGMRARQDNTRPYVAKIVRHMQLLPWPAISPDMLLIEYVWDLVGRRLACDPHPAASKDKLLLRIQAI
ncbi:transposable element Tc1 transposase [Trichonephila clavipes]|nr:transposable element Tc1 transposase [Trichonephila clavipes]